MEQAQVSLQPLLHGILEMESLQPEFMRSETLQRSQSRSWKRASLNHSESTLTRARAYWCHNSLGEHAG
jgi:hypothetical protein